MRIKPASLLFGLFLTALSAGSAGAATTIVADNYNIANSGSGFALGSGVNSGINPPTTRLTGTFAANLRYVKVFGAKADTAHYITNSTKLGVARVSTDSSTLSLSTGSTPYDYSPALNILATSPAQPATYEMTINMLNGAAANQRCSFAISSVSGTATTWDFAIQLVHVNTSDTFYTVYKRVSANSSGGAAVNAVLTTVPYPAEAAFLIRVTDAGAEPGSFNSRVQVSTNAGVSFVYDTVGDPDLPSGFRFTGSSRFIFWDIAGGAGPVTYDNFSLNWISGPTAATRIWNGGGADDNWSSPNNWGGIAPVTGDSLVFNGTTRQNNNNDISGLSVPWVTFNNGGFTLNGNEFFNNTGFTNASGINTIAGPLTFLSTAGKNFSLASGSELVLNNTTTVEVNGDNTIGGGGTLRVKGAMNIGQASSAIPAFVINEGKHVVDGGTFASRGGYRIGSVATGTGAQTIVSNNATFNLTVAAANLRVGDSANPNTARLVVNNSTLTMASGGMGIPYAAGATGEVAQTGGTVSGAILNFSQSGAGMGTYTLKNGTLDPIQIKKTTAAGVASMYFDNAILRSSPGVSNAFFTGLNTAEIQAGGLTFDAQADVTVGQVLSGAGQLVKTSGAAVTLTGANTYTGNTLVQAGKLSLPTVQTNTTTIQVSDTAEFGVNVRSQGTTLQATALNFNGASFSTLSFDLGSLSTPTAPLMRVTSLSVAGPVTINVANGLQLTTGQFVLVDYSGSIAGGFQFTLVGLPLGVVATLSNNVANSSIDLVITGVPGLIWSGAINGDWDGSTTNWISKQSAQPTAYSDGLPVEFLDGASNPSINIVGFPVPATITVSNNSLPYTWSGGGITVGTLKKTGTSSLTRIDGQPDAITTLELNQGTFVASSGANGTFTTTLIDNSPSTGTFAKAGAGTLTITSTNNTYAGTVSIQEGTVKAGNDRALGTAGGGNVVIASGATLDLNNVSPGAEPVSVAGDGVGGIGAIIDATTDTGVDANLQDVTLTADTTFGVPNNGRWDIRVRSGTGAGPGLKGNGFNLTKVGSGYVSIACQRSLGTNTPYWQMNLGDITINAGTLAFAESLSLGNPAKALIINPDATLQLYDLGWSNPIVRNITMISSHLTCGGSPTDTNLVNGTINITGANYIRPDQGVFMLNGPITGSGTLGIFAIEPGRVYLNGVSTFSGDTYVTNGTLGGTGVIPGNLIMLGGTNSPGMGIGTLTVNGNLTLAGTTYMELNRSVSPNSDRLVAGGTLTFGGRLQVVLGAGAASPQAGDVYQLFNKGGVGSFSPIVLPDISALPGGLAWDTTKLSVNGSISVTGSAAPPTITSIQVSGTNVVLTGTGGTAGNPYTLLSATNVGLALASWPAVSTNTFGAGGTFTVTNSVSPGTPARFYRVRVP